MSISQDSLSAAGNSPAADLVSALRGRVRGTVLNDPVSLALYSTDASPYRIVPQAVLQAADASDIGAAIEVCRDFGVSITARGAGTSLSGQCVGDGLQLDCSRLDQVCEVREDGMATVSPGTTWYQLEKASLPLGLEFGPDPATKRQCTLAGMIGTNAGGTHSLLYGASVRHIESVDVVLPDGTTCTLGESTDGSLRSAGAPDALAQALEGVRSTAGALLGPAFSDLARRGSGYQLEHLCTAVPHLGKFMAGSDGTLALITSAVVRLSPRPRVRVLAVVGFEDVHAAMEAVPGLVGTSPSAVELVSKSMIDIARRDPYWAHAVGEVPVETGALLYVEYQGDSTAEAAAGFERMRGVLHESRGVLEREELIDAAPIARKWAVREAGVGALSSVASGPLLPQAFVEDTIVAVSKLPGYMREFDAMFAKYGMESVWYGHASTGLIHVRPFLDMTSRHDLDRLDNLMRDTVDLVNAWGGDLCGEHGDGLSRTYWNERLFGPELYNKMRDVKSAFDPSGLLNPGKVVEGPSPIENLRYGPLYGRRPIATNISFADQGGFAGAAEKCFGAGVCRKKLVGTMCPPAAATGLEQHTTRARANLLRSVVDGSLDFQDLASGEAREVMETCVMCKACKSECPARVDMARMKIEWMDVIRRRFGATTLQRSVAHLRTAARLAAPFAGFVNWAQNRSFVKRRLGVSTSRTLPGFTREPLTRRLPSRAADVLLYADCFTTYQEPALGEAVDALATSAGFDLALAPAGCCGRTMLSEGYVDKARRAARRAAAQLRTTDGPIIFLEPSCQSAVTDDWEHLIGDVSDISSRVQSAEAWLALHGAQLELRGGGRAIFHGHCHQKALWGTSDTEAALRLVPDLDVEVLDAGCCGMAGAFGYMNDRYDLSVAMASRVLLPAVAAASPDTAVLATGTSCRHQIDDLGDREAVHPITFLASRLPR